MTFCSLWPSIAPGTWVSSVLLSNIMPPQKILVPPWYGATSAEVYNVCCLPASNRFNNHRLLPHIWARLTTAYFSIGDEVCLNNPVSSGTEFVYAGVLLTQGFVSCLFLKFFPCMVLTIFISTVLIVCAVLVVSVLVLAAHVITGLTAVLYIFISLSTFDQPAVRASFIVCSFVSFFRYPSLVISPSNNFGFTLDTR